MYKKVVPYVTNFDISRFTFDVSHFTFMLTHYIKISIRVLWKNKSFSFLNIAGLAVGLAVFILIMLWVQHEYSYNRFHANRDRIAEVMTHREISANEIQTYPAVPTKLAASMKTDLPGIEYASRVSWGDARLISLDDKNFMEFGLYADPDFLQIFSFPLISGNKDQVLKEPNTILLSEKLARKLFGDQDPVGKQVRVEQSIVCKVQGVVKEIPSQSSLQFDFLMPMQDYIQWAMNGNENWSSFNIKTYVKLKEGTDQAALAGQLGPFAKKYTAESDKVSFSLWMADDWYLRYDFKNGKYAGGGRIVYVNLFIAIAVFIILLACINFMNLSTARATRRAKEVGVRKATGAVKQSLIMQFMAESFMYTLLSGLIAIVLGVIALPFVNQFLRTKMELPVGNPLYLLLFSGIIVVTGVLAGSYPSWVLSAFRPVKVLKAFNAHSGDHSSWLRKGLVITQFTVSVLLIIGTLVVRNQVNFIKNKNLGYDREHLVWFQNNIAPEKAEAAINSFLKVPGVTNISRASMSFTGANNRGTQVQWPGKQPGEEVFFNFLAADQNIIQTMKIEMKEGRAFSKDFTTDTSSFIINEEAAKRMNLKNPVGQQIELYSGKGTIVGVCKDFHFESLHNPVGPLIIECRPDWTWLFYAKLDGKNTQKTLQELQQVYASFAPGYTMDYNFQDKEYERLYRSEEKIGILVNWFAFFAIFISCLGLLGLTSFTIERKTKEIGIRKVLGASVANIVSLISMQFLILVGVSILIAAGPAWYYMNEWLRQYAYRFEINVWLIAGAGLIVLLIAGLTIAVQAVKAAWMKPVKSLRAE